MMPRNMKEEPMSTHISIETPKQAEVDRYIAQAHQMRSDYISQLVKSGLVRLRGVFLQNPGHRQASA